MAFLKYYISYDLFLLRSIIYINIFNSFSLFINITFYILIFSSVNSFFLTNLIVFCLYYYFFLIKRYYLINI